MIRQERADFVTSLLGQSYPGGVKDLCALTFDNVFELLVATVLSAQTTDANVNRVTSALFRRFPDPSSLAGADIDEVQDIIFVTGFYRSKAQHIIGLSEKLCSEFGGVVPRSLAELVSLPGVGRKTANVVLSVGFGIPGLAVDTHVARVARRLGLTRSDDPAKIERDLCGVIPASDWGVTSLRLILHGRRVCQARNPRCARCVLAPACAYFSKLSDARGPGRDGAKASGSQPMRG